MAGRDQARLTAREGRRFGLTVGTAFLVLCALTVWRGHEWGAWITGTFGVLLITGALVVPGRMGPVYSAWMGLAHAISKVTTPIFMALVYYLAFLPIGLLMRLFGRRPMVHSPEDESYWVPRDPGTRQRADMERQF